MGKFVIKQAKNGEYYFTLKAGNGETILKSEMYKTKASCNNGIASVQKNCTDDNRYERLVAKNKQHFFNLKASNGQVIGNSEMYNAIAGVETGILSVKKNGVTTTIVEEE